MAQPFGNYSQYYDLLYADKDYAGETRYVVESLARFGRPSGSILEFGSGTGRHGRLLTESGYTVFGIERSPEMVAIANNPRNESFTSQIGDIQNVRLGKLYDAVISLFHVISYLTTNKALGDVFETAAAHLGAGGLFLFDVWHGPAVLCQRPTIRVRRMADEHLNVVRIAEPTLDSSRNLVTVNYTVFAFDNASRLWSTFSESHPMRYLFSTEIDFLARSSGFEVVCAEAFGTSEPPSENTWGVTYILKKTN